MMYALDTDLGGLVDPTGRRARLLVVDDQPTNIQTLYRLFGADHQVFMAARGEQALTMAQEAQPDLILLDVVMPDMDGFEICERLKQNVLTQDIPVLFVTAHNEPEQETRGLEVGGVDFISKPINPAVVRARVKTHLTMKLQSDLLKRMVFLDGLTGTFNRRYFDHRLLMEWQRAERDHTPLGLIMLDVDFFKRYNDHYGHQQGDDCLRHVAMTLRQAMLRPGDVVTRYGGEEFACVLPDTDLAGALRVAERMIQAVHALGLPHAASSVPGGVVTISAGCAVKLPAPGQRATDLLALADAQLYQAKSQGRNRICSAVLPHPVDAPQGVG